jgi:hypothetical protein
LSVMTTPNRLDDDESAPCFTASPAVVVNSSRY